MIRNNKKKGFTLVELLVVISIIAILATVSVVSYLAFVNRAHESNDISLTTQMNTVLSAENAVDKVDTMSEAVEVLADNGIVVDSLSPASDGYYYVWDRESKLMFLLDKDKNVVSPEGKALGNDVIAIAHNDNDVKTLTEAGYGVYLASDYSGTSVSLSKLLSLDAGSNQLSSVTIDSDETKSIYVAGNISNLTLDTPNASVEQYGENVSLNAAVASNSLHINGVVVQVNVTKGRVVVEANAEVNLIVADNSAGDDHEIIVDMDSSSAKVINYTSKGKNTNITFSNSVISNSNEVNSDSLSDDYVGLGTEDSPYLISDEEDFLKITNVKGSDGKYKTRYYKLINDIYLENSKNVYPLGVEMTGYLSYVPLLNLDGDNHTIYDTTGVKCIIERLDSSTIKNVTFDFNGTSSLVGCSLSVTYDNVKIIGEGTAGQNLGAYTVYANIVTFNNCEMAATLVGPASASDYGAVFVGYGVKVSGDSGVYFAFNNCKVSGSLETGKASIFLGNPFQGDKYYITINNFENTGTIKATYTGDANYLFNPIVSVASKSTSKVDVTMDGTSYVGTEAVSISPMLFGGNFVKGESDPNMKLELAEDGSFIITPSNLSNVSYYVITLASYATLNQGGTSVNHIYEKVMQGETVTTTLKNLCFVDDEWVKNNPTATSRVVESELGDYTIYSLDGVEYYYLEYPDVSNTGGKPKAMQLYALTAYDADGNVLFSTGLSK